MEQLLHYVWKHKLFPLTPLTTTDNRPVEVIDVGLPNRDAGPDFFNAKVKIDGTLWVGNIEIHLRSSDWYAHKHQLDANYNNVILHIAGNIDAEITTLKGDTIPQIQLNVPQEVLRNYEELLHSDNYPPCYKVIPSLSKLMLHSWMSALQTERLEQKTQAIGERVRKMSGDWEAAYFVTLARNFGFGINGDAFEQWALSLHLDKIAHHRDNLLQVEAFFFGQAGLLNEDSIPERYRKEAAKGSYYQALCSEYRFLLNKFKGSLSDDDSIKAIDFKQWKFLRLRPQNFPHIRIAQLAYLYHARKVSLSAIAECENIKQIKELLQTSVSDFWQEHYVFSDASDTKTTVSDTKTAASDDKTAKKKQTNKHHLSQKSIELIIINTFIPMLFAYGRYKSNERLTEKAFELLEALKAENNAIVRMWQQVGLEVKTAGDAQALIQLKKNYCDSKDCLRCRIGYEYLKHKKER